MAVGRVRATLPGAPRRRPIVWALTPSQCPNPRESTAIWEYPAVRRLGRGCAHLQDLSAYRRPHPEASHARGRWFEPSRAHSEKAFGEPDPGGLTSGRSPGPASQDPFVPLRATSVGGLVTVARGESGGLGRLPGHWNWWAQPVRSGLRADPQPHNPSQPHGGLHRVLTALQRRGEPGGCGRGPVAVKVAQLLLGTGGEVVSS